MTRKTPEETHAPLDPAPEPRVRVRSKPAFAGIPDSVTPADFREDAMVQRLAASLIARDEKSRAAYLAEAARLEAHALSLETPPPAPRARTRTPVTA